MALSTEAILSLVSVFVNLPPALFIVWKLYSRQRAGNTDPLGRSYKQTYSRDMTDAYTSFQSMIRSSWTGGANLILNAEGGLSSLSKDRHSVIAARAG